LDKRSIRYSVDIDAYQWRPIYNSRNHTSIGMSTLEHLFKRPSISFVGKKCVRLIIRISYTN
jgi:hypothetical protein